MESQLWQVKHECTLEPIRHALDGLGGRKRHICVPISDIYGVYSSPFPSFLHSACRVVWHLGCVRRYVNYLVVMPEISM